MKRWVSRGIGGGDCLGAGGCGADVALVGRDAAGLEATWLVVERKGRRCVAIEADLATVEGPRVAGVRGQEFFGGVDILVNNAGVFHRESILEMSVDDWDERRRPSIGGRLFSIAQAVVPGDDRAAEWQGD